MSRAAWLSVALLVAVAVAPLAYALNPPTPPERGIAALLSPTPALPATTTPGGSFEIVTSKPVARVEVFGAFYEPGTGIVVRSISGTPTPMGSSGQIMVYRFAVGNLPPGTYDVYVEFEDASKALAPRALWIHQANPDRLLVLHMSDLHFGTGDANYKLTSYLLAQLLGADLIVNTGDEADTADVHQYDQSLAYRYEFAYTVPEVLVPGNHDYPPKNFLNYYGNTTVVCWRPLPWLLVTGGYTWEIGHYNKQQLAEIEECLKANSDAEVKIMIMHHPVFYWQGLVKLPPDYSFTDPHKDPKSPLSYYWGTPEALKEGLVRGLLELVVNYNVTIVMAGHIHRDQYVLYEPPGGGVHYFITTTTSGHSQARPNYNGVQAILVYRNGSIAFPYAPKSFVGFKNASRSTVYNSIPVDPHPQRAPDNYGYIYVKLILGPKAYVFQMVNKYSIGLSRVVLLPLPALHLGFYSENASGGAHVEVLDSKNITLPTGVRYTVVALNVTLPPGSSDTVILAAEPDKDAPTASLEYTIPSEAKAGSALRVFIGIDDDSTGLLGKPSLEVADDKGRAVNFQVLAYPEKTPGDLFLYIPKTPEDASKIIVRMTLEDPAGHKALREVVIPLTGTIHTTTEATTTTTSGTTATTGTSTPAPPPTGTTETTKAGGNTALIAAAVIVIIVIIAALALSRR